MTVIGVLILGIALGTALGLLIGARRGSGAAASASTSVDTSPPSNAPEATESLDPRDAERLELADRLETAIDGVDLGLVICDAEGRVIYRNRLARRLAAARHARALVEAAVEELLVEALAGRTASREVSLYGPPSEAFVVRVAPLGAWAGGGAMAVVDNITDRKRTETVRRDFVANISHELKTPIGALGLLAETLLDEPDAETVRRLAARMVHEAERAADTVDDLLELSRIEFGDDAEFTEQAIADVFDEAFARVAAMAEHRQVRVRLNDADAAQVNGDRRQLVSAVFNLIDNAVKYSPAGSEVLVEVRAEPDEVLVAVIDSGMGIPTRDLGRIFERFYRVDRARSRDTGGTGLGLAIVRHVASNHGGEVGVESIEGMGTRFELRLPALRPSPTTVDPSTSVRPVPFSPAEEATR